MIVRRDGAAPSEPVAAGLGLNGSFTQAIDEVPFDIDGVENRLRAIDEIADSAVGACQSASGFPGVDRGTATTLKRHLIRAALDRSWSDFTYREMGGDFSTDVVSDEDLQAVATRRYRQTRQFMRRRTVVLTAAIAVSTLLLVGAFVVLYVSTSLSSVSWTTLAAGLIGLVLSAALMFVSWLIVEWRVIVITEPEEWAMVGALFAVFAAIASAVYWYAGRLLDRPTVSHEGLVAFIRTVAAGIVLGPVIAIALAAIFVAVVSATTPLLRSATLPCFVDSFVVATLTDTLLLARSDDVWTTLDKKEPVLDQLELAARVIETGIPGSVRTRDIETEEWLRIRAGQLAHGVRGLKRWVCSPQQDTRLLFSEKLAHLITSVALGHWDELAVEAPTEQEKPRRSRQILQIARTLVGGVGPLLVALVLVQQGVLTGAMTAPVLLFTGSLAFIVLLGLVDPESVQRLSGARDLASSLTVPPKKN